MRKTVIATLLALLLSSSVGGAVAQDNPLRGTLAQGELERTYVLHVPPGYDAAQPTPLVIVLHGANMTGITMMSLSGFNSQADAAGALVVYPDAINRRWQYLDANQLPPSQPHIDDVGFVEDLVEHLAGTYAVDRDRIAVIGYSNGGMLALRLRCSLAGRLAGVVSVSGNLTGALAVHCPGADPVSTAVVLGTQDPIFPWSGYAVPVVKGIVEILFGVNQTMTFLALLQDCDLVPAILEISPPEAETRILSDSYRNCADGTSLRLYSLLRFGHDWAGDLPVLRDDGIAGTLSEVLWDALFARPGS